MQSSLRVMCLVGALISLTGCSSVSGLINGADSIISNDEVQDQNFAEKQEIMDYYAEGMKYANISVRTAVGEDEVGYNSIEPNSDTWNKLISNYQKVIVEHSKQTDYEMPTGLHDYFKVFTDQMVLSDSTVKRAKESGGYYYLTIEFKVSPNQIGTFTNRANYLGLDGVIERDYQNQDSINSVYLRTLLNKVNDTRLALQKPLFPNYEDGQTDTPVAETQPEETPVSEEANDEVSGENQEANSVPETEDTTQTANSSSETAELEGEILQNVRRLPYDISNIAYLGGSSQEQISYMPEVELVYNVANTEGEMNGFGMYQEGISGLTSFGYDKNQDESKLIVTFVFQQNELSPEEMNYSFMFINSYENSNPIFSDNKFVGNDITVPDFLNSQLGMLIEEIDRAVNNRDIRTLMSNEVIDDDGLGLRYATYGKSSDIVTFATSIKRIAQRTDKTYLLEIERTVEDSPKNAGSIAQYRDNYYAVVRQDGTNFMLNDIILEKRELTNAPVIEAESATIRRLVALNLSGEVSDNTKLDITNGVLKNLADYSTNRTTKEDGSIAMYDCFDKDTSLLSEERKEYINSKMRTLLFAKGYNAKSTLYIQPTDWIGGYDTQVEFTTKELYDYEGQNAGTYVENYYLVSHYGTEWLIDDVITIKEELLEGDAYNQIAAQFKK